MPNEVSNLSDVLCISKDRSKWRTDNLQPNKQRNNNRKNLFRQDNQTSYVCIPVKMTCAWIIIPCTRQRRGILDRVHNFFGIIIRHWWMTATTFCGRLPIEKENTCNVVTNEMMIHVYVELAHIYLEHILWRCIFPQDPLPVFARFLANRDFWDFRSRDTYQHIS